MVGVRRPPPSRGSYSAALRMAQTFHFRIILCLVAGLYGITVLVSFGLDPTLNHSSSNNNNNENNHNHVRPIRLEELLESPRVVMSPEQPTSQHLAHLATTAEKGTPVQQQQQRNPFLKHSYHLEEPDIHMHPPDELKQKESQKVDSAGGNMISSNHDIVLGKTGTGPTSVAYVIDFDVERGNPSFRHGGIKINDASSIVAAQINEPKVTSCVTLRLLEDGPRHWTKQEACLAPETRQIVYNGASFPRIWCGQEIAPSSVVVMKEHCSDDVVYLFGKETPPVSGQGMAPMTLLAHHDKVRVETQPVDCDIPCVQETGISVTEAEDQRFFEGEPWVITQTLGDSMLNPYARIERIHYRRDIYYSTQSFKSSVPLSFYHSETFHLRNRPPVAFESALPKAVYMVNKECIAPHSKRQKYFAAISKIFPVDSLGDCHHNAKVPDGMTIQTMEGRIEIMKQYRFVLAFDRTKEKDQISPDIWEAMISGSVPVIVGADNIRLHLPARSFIDSNAYSDWDELAEAIQRISGDQQEWESYHAWRTDENELSKFESMYEFTDTSPSCRLCRWGYAKKYGLGWDHTKQQVKETHLSRNLCTSSQQQLALRPFQEEWISRNDKDQVAAVVVDKETSSEAATCQARVESVVTMGSTFKIHRKLLEHDGLIDILITDIERESIDNQLVLRLHIPGIRNSEGAFFADTHTAVPRLAHSPIVSSASIQDDYSKVTIVADWETRIWSPEEGVLEIVVVERKENDKQPTSPLLPIIPKRLRIIVEDMNSIHDKMTEYFPSSFASKVIKDFIDPLEVYY